MCRLRSLEPKDANNMLRWMQDWSVVGKLKGNFNKKTINDCYEFIENSLDDRFNIHKAIVDKEDEYIGTVSLKNIENGMAEFAIVISREAMGKGIAIKAMKKMLKFGFQELGLQYIYWYVSKDNNRALRFYDKNGFSRIKDDEIMNVKIDNSFVWYGISSLSLGG